MPIPGSLIGRIVMRISYTVQGTSHPKAFQREENFQHHTASSPTAYLEWMPAHISPNLHPFISVYAVTGIPLSTAPQW